MLLTVSDVCLPMHCLTARQQCHSHVGLIPPSVRRLCLQYRPCTWRRCTSKPSPVPCCMRDRDGAPSSSSGGRVMRVLFNVPNTVGWLRLCMLLVAISQMGSRPLLALWLHAVSLALDYVDGLLARVLKQVGRQEVCTRVFIQTHERQTDAAP